MKRSLIIGTITLGIVAVTAFLNVREAPQTSHKTIAVIMTLSHQALEDARRGFIDNIRARYGDDISVKDYNAEGNSQQANLIAQQVASNKDVIGIFAIGTLAAQTIAQVEHKKPIVVAAVSDPSMLSTNPASNLCGVTDAIDADYQIATVKKLLPRAQTIALLYSPAEANSTSMVNKLFEAAARQALTATRIGVHEPQQIAAASAHACKTSDAVVIPLDNQLVAAMPIIIKATQEFACPIITSNESGIHQGATIAFGVDYKKSGADAAEIMHRILDDNETPARISFVNPQLIDLFVNVTSVIHRRLSITYDETLTVKKIGGEKQL